MCAYVFHLVHALLLREGSSTSAVIARPGNTSVSRSLLTFLAKFLALNFVNAAIGTHKSSSGGVVLAGE
jgi:hypothetical protein